MTSSSLPSEATSRISKVETMLESEWLSCERVNSIKLNKHHSIHYASFNSNFKNTFFCLLNLLN
jgi:hypothetical protein